MTKYLHLRKRDDVAEAYIKDKEFKSFPAKKTNNKTFDSLKQLESTLSHKQNLTIGLIVILLAVVWYQEFVGITVRSNNAESTACSPIITDRSEERKPIAWVTGQNVSI